MVAMSGAEEAWARYQEASERSREQFTRDLEIMRCFRPVPVRTHWASIAGPVIVALSLGLMAWGLR